MVGRSASISNAKAGVLLHLVGGDARVQRQKLHPVRALVEAEEAEIGDHRNMPPAVNPAARRLSSPARKPGLVTKSTRSTNRRFSCFIATIICVRLAMSLPPPVPGSRVAGLAGIADERAVEIAVLVDLRPAHEADIDVAALQQEQHVGAAEHHVGAARAALLVGRRRQFPRLDKGADRAALEQDGEAGSVQPLRQGRRQQRDADAGENDLPVAQQPRADHREQLACGV